MQNGPETIVHATLIDNTLQSSRTILGFRSIKKALVTIVQLYIMFDGTQLFGSNKILLPPKFRIYNVRSFDKISQRVKANKA